MEQQPEKPRFGTKEWLINAIRLKFETSPDHQAETIESLADYLALKKIEAALWPPPEHKTAFIWIDPPDFPPNPDHPFPSEPTPGVIQ